MSSYFIACDYWSVKSTVSGLQIEPLACCFTRGNNPAAAEADSIRLQNNYAAVLTIITGEFRHVKSSMAMISATSIDKMMQYIGAE